MILATLLGCPAPGGCETPGEPLADARVFAALTDFQVGTLAFGSASAVGDPVLATGGDPLVRAGPSGLWVAERSAADTLTLLDPGDAGCPVWQVALPQGTNAHDIVERDGVVWVPSYDRPVLLGLSADDGRELHALDLSAYATSDDGLPEIDRVVAVGDRLWLAAQQFDRDGTIWTSPGGHLLAVDPSVPEVVDVLPTGPNPRIEGLPDGRIAVATGLLARGPNDPDAAQRRRDGALAEFDPATGTFGEPVLSEADLDADIGGLIAHPGGLVVLAVAPDAASRVICLGPDGPTEGPSGARWLVDGVFDGEAVVIAARRGLADDGVVPGGLVRLDPTSCGEQVTLPTPLDPIDLAVLPGAPRARQGQSPDMLK